METNKINNDLENFLESTGLSDIIKTSKSHFKGKDMEWDEFWESLLEEKKLKPKVEEMNQVDRIKGHTTDIEEICHFIYDDYKFWRGDYIRIKDDIWKIFETFPGVHLHTSRIKRMDSLIEKVIRKRYDELGDDRNRYANIRGDNYRDIITDLVGLRLIINYRGRWRDMHNEILRVFPFDPSRKYEEDKLLSHKPSMNIQTELPKVYYAEGDDIKGYVDAGLIPKKHKMNYRSIHYTVSFEGVYIEIQVRTIYDEAWSDCDHNYVYKKDDNKSHTALEQISGILAKLTNISNDIGDRMKEIYDVQCIIDNSGNGWKAPKNIVDDFDQIVERMHEVEADIERFRSKLIIDQE